jgi:hypothetical protein
MLAVVLQLITCIPTKKLPKLRRHTEEEVEMILQPEEDDRGQILWLRGLTRLQQQVCSHVSSYDLERVKQGVGLMRARVWVETPLNVFSK